MNQGPDRVTAGPLLPHNSGRGPASPALALRLRGAKDKEDA
jgi:hypothetical protein